MDDPTDRLGWLCHLMPCQTKMVSHDGKDLWEVAIQCLVGDVTLSGQTEDFFHSFYRVFSIKCFLHDSLPGLPYTIYRLYCEGQFDSSPGDIQFGEHVDGCSPDFVKSVNP